MNFVRKLQQLPPHNDKATIAQAIDKLAQAVVDKAESTQVADLAH